MRVLTTDKSYSPNITGSWPSQTELKKGKYQASKQEPWFSNFHFSQLCLGFQDDHNQNVPMPFLNLISLKCDLNFAPKEKKKKELLYTTFECKTMHAVTKQAIYYLIFQDFPTSLTGIDPKVSSHS